MLTKTAAVELVKELYPQWKTERDKLDVIDRWYRWNHEDIKVPREATKELKELIELSKTPWLGLVVSSVSQCMYVDGWKSANDPDRPDGEGPWKTWIANGFDQRQIAVHRGALAYGYSYVAVKPGVDDAGNKQSVMRGVSPRKMLAVYADPAEDDWPMYTIKVDPAPGGKHLVQLMDEEDIHFVEVDKIGEELKYIENRTHGAGVCPVVRYAMPDLDGRCDGQVEPFISLAKRINKTAYDRLLTQHFNSWKIRTVTGMAKPEDDAEAKNAALLLRQKDLLVAEDPDTRFGTLDETPLNGFIDSWRSDIEALAAVSQTPTHALTGQLINLSAEALAAARAGLTQKTAEWMKAIGRGHGQALRLASALEGNAVDALDVMGRVSWQDMEIRSMSQAVDALGKAATMLQVPVQALWGRIPGVEKSDVDDWKREAADALEADPLSQYANQLNRQANGNN